MACNGRKNGPPMPVLGRICLCLACVLICSIQVCRAADALDRGAGGHFRYATMFWQKTEDASSNTVQFTVESAWRYSYGKDHFVPQLTSSGDTVVKINGAVTPMVTFGDDTGPHFLESGKITAFSESEDWFLTEEVFSHTFATPNNRGMPWRVEFSGCCRTSGITNGGDSSWHMAMDVDLLVALSSLRIVSLPVIFISAGTPGPHFKLLTAGSDPTAEEVTWSSTDDSGGMLSMDATGKVTFSGPAPGGDFALYHLLAHAGSTARASVPLDIIVNVTNPARVTRPSLLSAERFFSHPYAAPLPLSDLDMFKVHAFPGFPLQVRFSGYQDTGNPSYIGYTVAKLPAGAAVSTVSGSGTAVSDPATMTLHLNACPHELGSVPVCVDVTDSEGVAATQRCLEVEVVPDPPPSLSLSLSHGDDCIWNCGGSGASWEAAELYIGRSYELHLTAEDTNAEDTLEIVPAACQQVPPGRIFSAPCEPLPWGSALSEPSHVRAATVTATRALPLEPAHSHGGYSMRHCFMATDGCGELRGGEAACGGADTCPGVRESTVTCVTLHVNRCQFVVRAGHSLNEVAAMYRTDWLQLWSHNQHLDSPDVSLRAGAVLQVGRVYDVQPHDTPRAVAERFGLDMGLFRLLNADVGHDGWGQAACTSLDACRALAGNLTGVYQWCLLPSSCTGASGSIYQGQPVPDLTGGAAGV